MQAQSSTNASMLSVCVLLERANGYLVVLFETLSCCLADPISFLMHACLSKRRATALTFCLLKVRFVTHGVLHDPTATNEDAATLLRRCRNHNVILRVCFHFALTV